MEVRGSPIIADYEWWGEKLGRADDAVCLMCREEDETLDHIVFRCQMTKRVKDMDGRDIRKWAMEEGMIWDSWGVLASNKWMRTENTRRVDEEGRELCSK